MTQTQIELAFIAEAERLRPLCDARHELVLAHEALVVAQAAFRRAEAAYQAARDALEADGVPCV